MFVQSLKGSLRRIIVVEKPLRRKMGLMPGVGRLKSILRGSCQKCCYIIPQLFSIIFSYPICFQIYIYWLKINYKSIQAHRQSSGILPIISRARSGVLIICVAALHTFIRMYTRWSILALLFTFAALSLGHPHHDRDHFHPALNESSVSSDVYNPTASLDGLNPRDIARRDFTVSCGREASLHYNWTPANSSTEWAEEVQTETR